MIYIFVNKHTLKHRYCLCFYFISFRNVAPDCTCWTQYDMLELHLHGCNFFTNADTILSFLDKVIRIFHHYIIIV